MISAEQKAICNNIQINFQCFGNSNHPAILLIMGLGGQMVLWDEDFCCKLAERGFYVIRFDNRDIGKSTWLEDAPVPNFWDLLKFNVFKVRLPAAYRLHDMAQDAVALLDHLQIHKAHVVGVSMGGMITQNMAISWPDRLISLTSIMSTTGSRTLPTAKPKVLFRMLRPLPANENKRLEQLVGTFRLLHGNSLPVDTDRVRELVSLSLARGVNGNGVMRQLAAIVASGDRTAKLAAVNLPTLVLHGDDDPLIPVACGHATAAAIPNAKMRVFKGLGHTLPSVIWEDMLDSLASHAESAT